MVERNVRNVYIWMGIILVFAGIVFAVFYVENETPVGTPGGQWSVYATPVLGVIQYPTAFTIREDHRYSAGPAEEVRGVAFVVSTEETEATNLAGDSYLSIEHVATSSCKGSHFLNPIVTEERIVDQGTSYTVLRGGGAAAGNLYEEIVYVTQNCFAIRYFIHTTRVENYEPGTVREYDRAALLSIFDAMRRSYRLPQ